MAPPTPVIQRDELNKIFQLEQQVDYTDCKLKSLTQNNCRFEGGLMECVPFKRLFRDCALKGKKQGRITVEITDLETNRPLNEAMTMLRAGERLMRGGH